MAERAAEHSHGSMVFVAALSTLFVWCMTFTDAACSLRFDVTPDLSIFSLSGTVRPAGTLKQSPGQTVRLQGSMYVDFPTAAGAPCPPPNLSTLSLAGSRFVSPPNATDAQMVAITPADLLARIEINGFTLMNVTLMDVRLLMTSDPVPPTQPRPTADSVAFNVTQTWSFATGLAKLGPTYEDLSGSHPVVASGTLTKTNNTAVISMPNVTASLEVTSSGASGTVIFSGKIEATARLGCPAACSQHGRCNETETGTACVCDCGRSEADCSTQSLPRLSLTSASVSPPASSRLVLVGPGLGDAVSAGTDTTSPLEAVTLATPCVNLTRLNSSASTCQLAPSLLTNANLPVSLKRSCQATARSTALVVKSNGTASSGSAAAPLVPSPGPPPPTPESANLGTKPNLPNLSGTPFDLQTCPTPPSQCYGFPNGSSVTGPCGCSCRENWTGLLCGTCLADSACQSINPNSRCSNSTYFSAATISKQYSCNITDGGLKSLIGNGSSFDCSVTDKFCRLGLMLLESNTSVFCAARGCVFDQSSVVTDGSDSVVNCATGECICDTPDGKCPTAIQAILGQVKGPIVMSCNPQRACTLKVGGLLAVLRGNCDIGECTDGLGVTLTYRQANWSTIGLGVGLSTLLLITACVIFACLRRRYRVRKEAAYLRWRAAGSADDVRGPGLVFSANNVTVDAPVVHRRGGMCRSLNVGKRGGGLRANIVSGVNVEVHRGAMLALMGPSGSGKTTLLNLLAAVGGGRSQGTCASGSITVDGMARDKSFRQLAAYVPQEDFLHSTLTVRESIEYSANLRLPAYMPAHMKQEHVRHVIDVLGLALVQDNRVGSTALGPGLSGGERRRVSIGMELVSDPRLLLLDEPTSGLDSSAAVRLVRTLREMAKQKGAIIIMSVHQPPPDLFDQFDQILLLSGRGRPVYSGSRENIFGYFDRMGWPCPADRNFAEHMMDVVSSIDGGEAYGEVEEPNNKKLYWKGDEAAGNHGVPNVHSAPLLNSSGKPMTLKAALKTPEFERSIVNEAAILLWRELISVTRRPTLLMLHLFVAALMALFVGGLYFNVTDDISGFQNRAGAMFFSVTLFSFCSLSALEAFLSERILFTAEGSSRYFHVLSYYLSKVLWDWLLLRILPVILYSMVMYWMIGLRDEGSKFLSFCTWLSLASMIAGSICSTISLLFSSVGPANIFAIIAMLLQLLFAGFLVNLGSISRSIRWLHFLSFPYYALENLLSSDLENKVLQFKPVGSDTAIPVEARVFLETFGLNGDNRVRNSWLLAAFVVGWALVTYALLLYRVSQATSFKILPPQQYGISNDPDCSLEVGMPPTESGGYTRKKRGPMSRRKKESLDESSDAHL